MAFTKDNAAEFGRQGGLARGSRAPRKDPSLTLERVERELGPPMTSVADAMHRLDTLNKWIAAGLLSGSQGGAAVRSIEVWLKGHESRLTEEVVSDLKDEIVRIKRDLRKQQKEVTQWG